MRAWGWVLVVAGVIMAGVGFIGDGSVASGADYGRVVNLGLLADKLMLVVSGGFLFLSGIVLLSASDPQQPGGGDAAKPRQLDGQS